MNRTKKNDLGRKYAESETKKEGFPFRHWKVIAFYLVLYDIVAVNFSYFFGLLIRFDLRYSSIPKEYLNAFIKFAPFYTAFVIIIFYVFRLYNSLLIESLFSESLQRYTTNFAKRRRKSSPPRSIIAKSEESIFFKIGSNVFKVS